MDATTAQPTLLSAAKNFIRKSAGTAVLVIAPLAAVSTAPEAKGQVVLGVPSFISGLYYSGGSTSGASSFFSSQLPQLGNVVGVKMGLQDAVYNFNGSSASGSASIYFPNSYYSGLISGGSTIPVAYGFTFTGTNSVTVSSWYLYLNIGGDSQMVATGSGLGTFSSASTDYVLTANTSDSYAVLQFDFSYGGAVNGDVLHLLMNSSTQGIAINATAIPEPSTYAGLFGLGALGLAMVRRWRRMIVA